jgi:hypothetical protein
MKKIILIFFLISGINQYFAQRSLCHEGSGGGPCFLTEELDNGSFDIVLDLDGNNEKCECPDVKVNVKKNAQGKYMTVYGSFSITLNVEDNGLWVYVDVKRVKPETDCCELLEGLYTEPAD